MRVAALRDLRRGPSPMCLGKAALRQAAWSMSVSDGLCMVRALLGIGRSPRCCCRLGLLVARWLGRVAGRSLCALLGLGPPAMNTKLMVLRKKAKGREISLPALPRPCRLTSASSKAPRGPRTLVTGALSCWRGPWASGWTIQKGSGCGGWRARRKVFQRFGGEQSKLSSVLTHL